MKDQTIKMKPYLHKSIVYVALDSIEWKFNVFQWLNGSEFHFFCYY